MTAAVIVFIAAVIAVSLVSAVAMVRALVPVLRSLWAEWKRLFWPPGRKAER